MQFYKAKVAIRSGYQPAQMPMYLGKQFRRGKCRGGGGEVGTTSLLLGREGVAEKTNMFYNFIFLINLCYCYNNE